MANEKKEITKSEHKRAGKKEGTSITLYSKVQIVIDELDKAFFSGKGKQKIPQVVFAINNRCKSCVVAYVQADALYDKSTDKKLQYLAINPDYLNRKLKDTLGTICHELCHVYENAFIHIPRGGYHDKQWAELMAECGLEPKYLNTSKTAVDHKIIKGGAFEDFVKVFTEKYGEDFSTLFRTHQKCRRRHARHLVSRTMKTTMSPELTMRTNL